MMKAIKNLLKISLIILIFAVGVSIIGCTETPDITTTAHPCAAGHTEVIDSGVKATCTEDGITDGKHCSVCNETLVPQESIPAKGHTVITIKAVAPSCSAVGLTEGKGCADCDYVTVKQEEIPKTEHTVVIDPEMPATCTEGGRTEGSHCSKCHELIVKCEKTEPLAHDLSNYRCTRCDYIVFTDISVYHSTRGYEYLGTLQKAEKLQELYRLLDEVASKFHTDTTVNLNYYNSTDTDQCLNSVTISNSNLTDNDVSQVLALFRTDHPVYYWLTANYDRSFGSNDMVEGVWLRCDNDFCKGEDRKAANEILYAAIEDYVTYAEDAKSDYLTSLAYYDMIISSIDYAHEPDGVTPNSSYWAHSVLGVFDGRGAVCEGYAKAFQLLLNFSKIENYYIRGDANGRHAWNLVKLDDGNWYWFDTTWDDLGDDSRYDYFCAIDDTFLTSHTPFTPTEQDYYDRMPPLPARPNTEFDSLSVLEVYEDFVVDGIVYEVSGYKKARYKGTIGSSAGSPASTVTYNGIVYTVGT